MLSDIWHCVLDTNFINFSIQNKLDVMQAAMDCLYAKCIPCITDCVMAELEKLGRKYRVALRWRKRIPSSLESDTSCGLLHFYMVCSWVLCLGCRWSWLASHYDIQNSKRPTVWAVAVSSQGHICWWLSVPASIRGKSHHQCGYVWVAMVAVVC